MVQVDLPAAFTIGMVFALLAKKYLKKEPDIFTNKLIGPLNLYMSCSFSPAGLFLLVGWPAWEVMYVTGWVEKPFDRPLVAGFYIVFFIAMMLLANVGFWLAHYWYKKGKDKLVAIGAIVGGIVTVSPFILNWGIWWNIGTYSDVTAGAGYSFFKPPFFHGWLAIMSYLAITTVLTGLWFKYRGSKIT